MKLHAPSSFLLVSLTSGISLLFFRDVCRKLRLQIQDLATFSAPLWDGKKFIFSDFCMSRIIVGIRNILILHMSTLKFIAIMSNFQGHRACKWPGYTTNPRLSDPRVQGCEDADINMGENGRGSTQQHDSTTTHFC